MVDDVAASSGAQFVLERMPPSSASTAATRLRSTGKLAAAPDEKLALAASILARSPTSFPLRERFVLDWLCGALRAKSGTPPPRADARYWRLFDALLPAVDGAVRSSLGQSSRRILQSATAALEADASPELPPIVVRVVSALLCDHAECFRPGSDLIAEYVAALAGAASGAGAGAASAAELLDALPPAVDALLDVHADGGARRMLLLVASRLLAPLLTLRGACADVGDDAALSGPARACSARVWAALARVLSSRSTCRSRG